jgi:hypothetical protein
VKGRVYQKLERVALALALAGEAVACDLAHCGAGGLACVDCAMRTRGWEDGRRVLSSTLAIWRIRKQNQELSCKDSVSLSR